MTCRKLNTEQKTQNGITAMLRPSHDASVVTYEEIVLDLPRFLRTTRLLWVLPQQSSRLVLRGAHSRLMRERTLTRWNRSLTLKACDLLGITGMTIPLTPGLPSSALRTCMNVTAAETLWALAFPSRALTIDSGGTRSGLEISI